MDSYEVKGRSGRLAKYVKEVDAEESTVRFYQEVFDADGRLCEVHEKYPVKTTMLKNSDAPPPSLRQLS
jgi:hypothetical protein